MYIYIYVYVYRTKTSKSELRFFAAGRLQEFKDSIMIPMPTCRNPYNNQYEHIYLLYVYKYICI